MNSHIAYAVRYSGGWWSGSRYLVNNVENLGSPFISDATFFTDPMIAEDVAKELGGTVKRVDLVTE